MPDQYPPINPRFPHFLHGADYNPDQWPREVWSEDMRLMKLANCNVMSVGIFSWTRLEPEEGRFDFSWLDIVMDLLAKNSAYALLATPSAARPAWMSQKYPEVLRVRQDRQRILHGARCNHCLTSPVYRQKTSLINRKLAEHYKNHPALLVWHISNEYTGDCHCGMCQAAFREWLKNKYSNDLDKLNLAWWSSFWSHTYTDWEQIKSPSTIGQTHLHGLNLDWKRFVADQTIDFFRNEIAPLRELTPTVPVTTNLMDCFPSLNYQKLARELDIVSLDSYPFWHAGGSDVQLAMKTAFNYDLGRSMKGGQPFMLMESTPSNTNWQPVPRLKRPGMHVLSSLQAVAHGSDTVQYFQWRKSRGSAEKFHGAVVDHAGHEHTRVFQEVARVGEILNKLDALVGTTVRPQVAIIYDWENAWAIEDMHALGRNIERRGYLQTAIDCYQPFWARGIPVDLISEENDFTSYRLVIAPMLYMLKPGVAARLRAFVQSGGTLVSTYWSGLVDENDLCFLGGWPGDGLREVFGIWDEETDTLAPGEGNTMLPVSANELGLSGSYTIKDYCALIHAESARVLATYASDFYAGRPVLTVNDYYKGQAYYLAARTEEAFIDDFFGKLSGRLALQPALPVPLPAGVSAQVRRDEEREFIFVMNFNPNPVNLELSGAEYHSLINGSRISSPLILPAYGVEILVQMGEK